jgi:hypothetical protein
MIDMDQDDVLLAPWTTIKYGMAGVSATTTNQRATTAANQPYPTDHSPLAGASRNGPWVLAQAGG